MSGKVDELIEQLVVFGAQRMVEVGRMSDSEMRVLCDSRGVEFSTIEEDESRATYFLFKEVILAMLTPAQLALLAGEPLEEQAMMAIQFAGTGGDDLLSYVAESAAKRPGLEL